MLRLVRMIMGGRNISLHAPFGGEVDMTLTYGILFREQVALSFVALTFEFGLLKRRQNVIYDIAEGSEWKRQSVHVTSGHLAFGMLKHRFGGK